MTNMRMPVSALSVALIGGLVFAGSAAAEKKPSQVAAAITESQMATNAGSYLAGRHAFRQRDFGSASRFFGEVLVNDPTNLDLLRRTFMVSLADGDVDRAESLAARLVERRPRATLARLTLSAASARKGDFAAASKHLEGAPRRGINGFVIPLMTAWALAGEERYDEAIEALNTLRDASGFAVLYHLHAGLVNDVAGRNAVAENEYREAMKSARRPTLRVVQAMGSLLQRTGRLGEAIEVYDGYLAQNPNSQVLAAAKQRAQGGLAADPLLSGAADGMAEALFNVAGTLTQENSASIAVMYARLATNLRPGFGMAQVLLGGLMETLRRYTDAIAIYDAIPSDHPIKWSARLQAADSLERMDKTDEAIERLMVMVGEDTDRYDALVTLGDMLRTKKRFSEAVDAYDKAVARLGDSEFRHWTIYYSRGIALERSKQWPRAEKDFREALRLNPDQPYVLNYLGYSWVDQGMNFEEAQKMIERAVELRPNDGYIVDSLGWVLYRQGKYEEAVSHLERAVELRPQDPVINDHLGDAYWRTGRQAEARFQWRRALSLEPEDDQVELIQNKIDTGMKAPEKPVAERDS